MKLRYCKSTLIIVLALAGSTLLPVMVKAQGSIFGTVKASDLSTPPNGAIQFIGIINNNDREIRIQSCIGAGYDAGNWFDDFQNYLTEARGAAYSYYFFDTALAESALLHDTIPANSFQQEDITLSSGTFPPAVSNLSSTRIDKRTIRLDWTQSAGTTWHVYRREGASDGSFFRIDDPAGNRNNRGVTVPYYVDNSVDSLNTYWYIVVSESSPGNYSPASEALYVDVGSCCQGLVGDINGIDGDTPTIGDLALLVDHIFIDGTPLECLAEADLNQSGGLHPTEMDITIGDAYRLIGFLYIDFFPLKQCTDVVR